MIAIFEKTAKFEKKNKTKTIEAGIYSYSHIMLQKEPWRKICLFFKKNIV